MSVDQLREHLGRLHAERRIAASSMPGEDDARSARLAEVDAELAACRAAYVATAVTEIASFRAQLSGPQAG